MTPFTWLLLPSRHFFCPDLADHESSIWATCLHRPVGDGLRDLHVAERNDVLRATSLVDVCGSVRNGVCRSLSGAKAQSELSQLGACSECSRWQSTKLYSKLNDCESNEPHLKKGQVIQERSIAMRVLLISCGRYETILLLHKGSPPRVSVLGGKPAGGPDRPSPAHDSEQTIATILSRAAPRRSPCPSALGSVERGHAGFQDRTCRATASADPAALPARR
jgi:hypothetical protein